MQALLDFLGGGLLQFGWVGLVVYLLVATQLTIFSVTLYLHRSQAHRGVDFHPVLAHFFRFWTWITTSMITKEWAAIHRKHHAKCETEEDPHSPMHKGIKTVFWRGVELYREARGDRESIEKYGKGCPEDWIERKVYTPHATMGPTLLLFISFALFGIPGVAVWAIQMLWIPFWAAGVVNGLGHWWGYRNFETTDTATNLTPWGVWIGGEELHNNHHAFPSSAKFALRKFEFDIGWAVIKLFEVDRHGQGAARRADARRAPEHQRAGRRDDQGAARASLPGDDRLPAQRAQAGADAKKPQATGSKLRAMLPRQLRKGLSDDGRWLKPDARQQMQDWVAAASAHPRAGRTSRPPGRRARSARQRRRGHAAEPAGSGASEAEASGIRALQDFSARLKGYQLQA